MRNSESTLQQSEVPYEASHKILQKGINKDKQIEVADEQIVEIIEKEAKKRKDSISDYEKSGRQDLLDQIKEEIAILEEYLPEQLSTEEVEAKVKEIITELGASSMKEMGMVMKTAKERLGASADGKTINDAAKKILYTH